ncbi:hypothetical protein GXW82_04035 [Streptacidiphilus sp. 4-A2]|nr:hypothetical protein [Streptacidiphilus sp. 4-A2]
MLMGSDVAFAATPYAAVTVLVSRIGPAALTWNFFMSFHLPLEIEVTPHWAVSRVTAPLESWKTFWK